MAALFSFADFDCMFSKRIQPGDPVFFPSLVVLSNAPRMRALRLFSLRESHSLARFAAALLLFLLLLAPSSSFLGRGRGIRIAKPSLPLSLNEKLQRTVDAADIHLRLDCFLAREFSNHSRSFFGGLCDEGKVLVNGKPHAKSHKLHPNQVVEWDSTADKSSAWTTLRPENIPLNILFEDEHLIVVNKPNGMVVHPAPGSPNGTFVNALLYHLGTDQSHRLLTAPTPPGFFPSSFQRPGIVHRLDKGTTGILLAGKHPSAVAHLSELFATRQVIKHYLAICIGHPGHARLLHHVARHPIHRHVMTTYPVEREKKMGKLALSHLHTLAFDGKLSLVLVRIETGRTHQIRVQLQARRTPVLGDDVYGHAVNNRHYLRSSSSSSSSSRPLLHAVEMKLAHPFTRQEMVFQAPLPRDMSVLAEQILARDVLKQVDVASVLAAITTTGGDSISRYI